MAIDQPERRLARRFDVHLPLIITSINAAPIKQAARSQNVSTHGICFHAEGPFAPGAALQFLVVLPPEITGSDRIHVRCRGVVQRVELEPDGSSLTVACTIAGQELVTEKEAAQSGARSAMIPHTVTD